MNLRPIQQILSHTRRAVSDYEMISEGDRIAVGVSGGKDSLTLLCALAEMRRFYPIKYEVVPVTLDMGFENADFSNIKELCDYLRLELVIEKTDIKTIVFDIRKEKNPCSLCANMRRGALNEVSLRNGCNKVATGHHFDDAVETMCMNLFNEGRIGCFSPVTYLDRRDITLIRPLIYVQEKEIKRFIGKSGVVPSPKYCPADGYTDRERTKQMLAEMEKVNPGVRMRIFGSMERAEISGFSVHERAKRTKND